MIEMQQKEDQKKIQQILSFVSLSSFIFQIRDLINSNEMSVYMVIYI